MKLTYSFYIPHVFLKIFSNEKKCEETIISSKLSKLRITDQDRLILTGFVLLFVQQAT